MIESPRNERLRRARRLLESRRARVSSGLFVVEGEDLVAMALEAGIEPVDVLVAAGATLAGGLTERLGERAHEVEPKLLAELGSLGHAARILAVCRRADLPAPPEPVEPDVSLILVGVGDPGNVGTLVRASAALGGGLLALAPGCADPFGPKALRASMGAVFRVPVLAVRDPLAAVPGARTVALAGDAEVALQAVDLTAPVAFLLGAEREGLAPELVAGADVAARIPQTSVIDSLNVAMAGTIALYEARSGRENRLDTGGLE